MVLLADPDRAASRPRPLRPAQAVARGAEPCGSARRARRRRRSRAAAAHARRPALELDLCARRDDFEAMTDVSKELRARSAAHYSLEPARDRHRAGLRRRHAQVAAAAARRQAQRGARRPRSRPSTSPRPTAAPCASRARSAARSTAPSAIPARSGSCAISLRRRSSGRSCSRATASATGPRAARPAPEDGRCCPTPSARSPTSC